MAEIKHGTVTITVDDELEPPEKAGKMSPAEIASIPRAPLGIGLACDQAADSIDRAKEKFVLPRDVTADSLREAGSRAENVDMVIADLTVVLETLKQANLLFDADAWEQLRKVNDQVKAQGKHDPELLTIFDPLVRFMKGRRKRGSSTTTTE